MTAPSFRPELGALCALCLLCPCSLLPLWATRKHTILKLPCLYSHFSHTRTHLPTVGIGKSANSSPGDPGDAQCRRAGWLTLLFLFSCYFRPRRPVPRIRIRVRIPALRVASPLHGLRSRTVVRFLHIYHICGRIHFSTFSEVHMCCGCTHLYNNFFLFPSSLICLIF